MEVKLVVIGGQNSGQKIAVSGPKFVIGRGEDCQLRPRSPMVSRRHCAILLEEGRVAIEDFGSKNGTFVNGEPVKGQRDLKAGDRLTVGPLEFEVQLTVGIGGKKKPRIRSIKEAAARTVEAAAGEELDITQWLEDEQDEDDTMSVGGAVPEPGTEQPQHSAAHQPSAAEQLRTTTKKPDSSREAAASVLRKFFDNKKF